MKLKIIILLMLLLGGFSLVSSVSQTDIGVKKQGDCIDFIQICADCSYVNFSSYTQPNGTRIVNETEATKSGATFTLNKCNVTGTIGTWIVDGHGDLQGTDTVFAYTYEVTSSGNATPDGVPSFQLGIIIIIFATSCFFLYLSLTMGEAGFKIFFLILSLIFLVSTMLMTYLIGTEINVAASANSATLALFIVLGAILFIVFIYVMIRQTINILDMLRVNRGLKMDSEVGVGRSVAGYDTRRAY